MVVLDMVFDCCQVVGWVFDVLEKLLFVDDQCIGNVYLVIECGRL